MPERRGHHVLNVPRLAIGERYLHLLWARAGSWSRSGCDRRAWRRLRSWLFRLWLNRLAIPLGIAEMQVRLHEIVNREVIFAVEKPRAASDDLLEFNHRIDRTHQNDVADVARI